jgi:threonine dehydrogenase-like Zn-dependent dehydrogenase
MKAAVLEKYHQFTWKDIPQPERRKDEVLVKIKHASICGTDQHIFTGEFHPRTKPPFVPGHEFAGVVEETGEEIQQVKANDLVAVDPVIWCGTCEACRIGHYPACANLKLLGVDMDGGFAEYVSVPEHMLFKVRPDVDPRYAALVEVLSIGFHASARAQVKQGDSIAIWGAGKVGQCILQATRTKTNGPVFMVDIIQNRLERAKKAYPDIEIINAIHEDTIEFIKSKTNDNGVDIAFEAVGHAQDVKNRLHPVRSCIQAIRGAGTVCVLGLADDPAPLVMKELIWKEAKIVASRVSHGEFAECINQLEQGNLKPDVLITSEMHASKAQEAFKLLENEPENQLKILLDL